VFCSRLSFGWLVVSAPPRADRQIGSNIRFYPEVNKTCMPWGTVTYSPQGWKIPCYLLMDVQLPSFGELLNGTDWEAYGPNVDPRCGSCNAAQRF
jgi:hypothetical protein